MRMRAKRSTYSCWLKALVFRSASFGMYCLCRRRFGAPTTSYLTFGHRSRSTSSIDIENADRDLVPSPAHESLGLDTQRSAVVRAVLPELLTIIRVSRRLSAHRRCVRLLAQRSGLRAVALTVLHRFEMRAALQVQSTVSKRTATSNTRHATSMLWRPTLISCEIPHPLGQSRVCVASIISNNSFLAILNIIFSLPKICVD